MSRKFAVPLCLAPAFFVLALFGCGGVDAPPASGDSHADEHAHPSAGPHGGALVELGHEEYHGEVVHNDKEKTVEIYILDAAGKKNAPIEASAVLVNTTLDNQPRQFRVLALAAPGDPAGRQSRFVSGDADLIARLDHPKAECELAVTIEGTPFRGKIPPEHEHDHQDER